MKTAFLFSGQGAQFVGMGKDLENNEIAYKNYRNAQNITGISILDISKNGDEETLNISQNTQLSIVTLQSAIIDIFKSNDIESHYTAGLSLGEYSALYNAEVLSFKNLLTLVKARGEIMQDFANKNPGSKMIVVLGLESSQINAYVKQVKDQGQELAVANYNTPLQQVVGGTSQALALFKDVATEAKRIVDISVAVPSHTPMMEPIVDDFSQELEKVLFNELNQTFYANTTGEKTETTQIKDLLIKQLTNPTHMDKIITNMLQDGVELFIEIGPKKVLSSFVKKIAQTLQKEVKILNAFDLDSTNQCIKIIKEN